MEIKPYNIDIEVRMKFSEPMNVNDPNVMRNIFAALDQFVVDFKKQNSHIYDENKNADIKLINN